MRGGGRGLDELCLPGWCGVGAAIYGGEGGRLCFVASATFVMGRKAVHEGLKNMNLLRGLE